MNFDEMLDEVETLPDEDLYMFNEILSNRVRDMKREELTHTVFQARKEYSEGNSEEASIEDIMNEIMS